MKGSNKREISKISSDIAISSHVILPIETVLSSDTVLPTDTVLYRLRPNIIGNINGVYKMVMDTETNGLNDTKDVLQIAWVIFNSDNEIIKKVSIYVKNRKNKPDAFEINKISDEVLEEQGILFYDVIKCFVDDLNTCDTVIGHNVLFDTKAINKNIERYNIPIENNNGIIITDIFKEKNIVCTLKLYKKYLEPIEKNYEKPISKKLVDMFKSFFGHDFENAHDALGDVLATFECYNKLLIPNLLDMVFMK
jgi:DNA polymerase III epsilon subunit-like protein